MLRFLNKNQQKNKITIDIKTTAKEQVQAISGNIRSESCPLGPLSTGCVCTSNILRMIRESLLRCPNAGPVGKACLAKPTDS